jgi:hypothetical protein
VGAQGFAGNSEGELLATTVHALPAWLSLTFEPCAGPRRVAAMVRMNAFDA